MKKEIKIKYSYPYCKGEKQITKKKYIMREIIKKWLDDHEIELLKDRIDILVTMLLSIEEQNIKKTNNEEKVIIETRKKIERLADIPDELKEKFYRGVNKRDCGYDMIAEVMVALQRIDKWYLPKK